MQWLLLIVLSDLLSASNVVLAKVMLTQHVLDRRLYIFSAALVTLPFAVVGARELASMRSIQDAAIALAVGMFYIVSGVCYYKAMAAEKAFHVSVILRLSPVAILIMSVVAVNERLSAEQYFGFGLTVAAGLALTVRRASASMRLSRGLGIGSLGMLSGAVASTLTAYLLEHYQPFEVFTVTRVGMVIGTLLILRPVGTADTCYSFLHLSRRHCCMLLLEQIVRLVTLFLHTMAVSNVGSATLVAGLSGFGPLYVWVIGYIRGDEQFQAKKEWIRLGSILMLAAGSFLIAHKTGR